MRVALDLTGIEAQPVGTATYMRGLALALGRLDRESEFVLYVTHADRRLFHGRLPANFSVRAATFRPRPARLAFEQAALPALARTRRFDVVHSPGPHLPLLRGARRHALTAHDITPLTMPAVHTRLRSSWPYRRMLVASLRRADSIIVPSRFVAGEIRRRVPEAAERLEVVPWGIDPRFTPAAAAGSAPVLERLGVRRPYVLYVGKLEPRKNLVALVESYHDLLATRELREDLVLAGPQGWRSAELDRLLRRPALDGRVHLPGYVADSDLPSLYASAKAFVYPSLEEGFGFPPLEAMASGVPTVSTAGSSLGENLTGAAELVPPGDRPALRSALERVLADEVLRARLRDAGLRRAERFSWERCARAHLAAYRELC
jgi:alpha-1,3-rhamnosyl/mannosyltransferase